jgi:hypothetical protein
MRPTCCPTSPEPEGLLGRGAALLLAVGRRRRLDGAPVEDLTRVLVSSEAERNAQLAEVKDVLQTLRCLLAPMNGLANRVVDVPALPTTQNDGRTPEDRQVMGDLRLVDTQTLDQVRDTEFPVDQDPEDSDAVDITDSLQAA